LEESAAVQQCSGNLDSRDSVRRMTGQALRLSRRLGRWLTQGVPNLVRVRTQFNASALRMSSDNGVWNPNRRQRRATAQEVSASLH
jgi:hypothetical protein